jgi:sugar lactone lactonase YvrE
MRGTADGTGPAARFSGLSGLTVDAAGNVFVADVANCRQLCPVLIDVNIIRKITPDGVVTTLAGTAGKSGMADGMGAAAMFYIPSGLGTDSAGNLYVADCGNGALRKITPAGVVTTVASSGVCSGSVLTTLTSPSAPSGVAVDGAGNIYVSDSRASVIRKVTPSGLVTTVAGSSGGAAVDGTGASARFDGPQAIAVDAGGNAYVADTLNNSIRMISPAGVVTTIAGKFGASGIMLGSLPGSLTSPKGVAIDGRGVLTVSTGDGIVKIQ